MIHLSGMHEDFKLRVTMNKNEKFRSLKSKENLQDRKNMSELVIFKILVTFACGCTVDYQSCSDNKSK